MWLFLLSCNKQTASLAINCNLAICCHQEVNRTTAESCWRYASVLNYTALVVPIHPPVLPSLTLNWQILWNHLATPPTSIFWFDKCHLLLRIYILGHTFSAGISTVSLMASDPCRIVPVMTVPCPRMEKQWSTAIRRSPPGSLWGR